jgi:hypothetical protein
MIGKWKIPSFLLLCVYGNLNVDKVHSKPGHWMEVTISFYVVTTLSYGKAGG